MHDKTPLDSAILLNCELTKVQTIIRAPQYIENQENQKNFIAQIASPVWIIRIDPDTGKPSYLEIDQEYPLYPIVKLIDGCLQSKDINELTFDIIQKAYLDTVNAITDSAKKFLIQNENQSEQLNASLFFITRTLEQLTTSITPNLFHLAEINLKLVKLCKKHTIVKKFKADLSVLFECCLSGALELLLGIHFSLKNWELAETYCYQLLGLLPTFKRRDQGNIVRRYCDTNFMLSSVYLQYGHTKNAIKFLEKGCDFIKNQRIDNFEELLLFLTDLTKDIINNCKEHADALYVIILAKTTITALSEKISKLSPNYKKLFICRQTELNEASTQAEKKYLSALRAVMANSSPIRSGKLGYYDIRFISKELKKIQHNFSSEHPYRFKIVIPNQNERLYGWIEEVIVDEKGKRHYLVCFGYVDDHKIKSLPNPITQKQLLDRVVANKNNEPNSQIQNNTSSK
jgi:hypothetical protein